MMSSTFNKLILSWYFPALPITLLKRGKFLLSGETGENVSQRVIHFLRLIFSWWRHSIRATLALEVISNNHYVYCWLCNRKYVGLRVFERRLFLFRLVGVDCLLFRWAYLCGTLWEFHSANVFLKFIFVGNSDRMWSAVVIRYDHFWFVVLSTCVYFVRFSRWKAFHLMTLLEWISFERYHLFQWKRWEW